MIAEARDQVKADQANVIALYRDENNVYSFLPNLTKKRDRKKADKQNKIGVSQLARR